MSDKLFPNSHPQNPAPVEEPGLEGQKALRAQVENVMTSFKTLLADTYSSEVPGPNYYLQFEAFAEQIARIQLGAQEAFSDSDFDFTRSEFLFQILGALIFPNGDAEGIPDINGDVTYRDFLKQMILLLLEGSKKVTLEQGVALLTNGNIQIIEKALASRNDPGSAWGFDEQFEFEINVSDPDGDAFPDGQDPLTLQENIRLVMQALKPAHTVYQLRYLFLETFEQIFEAEESWESQNRYYEDVRKYCYGTKSLNGTTGETLANRFLFRDLNRDFSRLSENYMLTITAGANTGVYRIQSVFALYADDATPRAYTTTPSGLTGTATVEGDTLTDASQDWSQAVEGEILTFAEGPNAGSYRLQETLSYCGDLVGQAKEAATSVRVAPTLLRLYRRMPVSTTGQTYSGDVDRLGVKIPRTVTAEDVSSQFFL